MKRLMWLILIVGFLFFSLSPFIYEWTQKDKLVGRTFEPVHNYVTDYNFYLSRIREGIDGRWTVVERYTGEVHSGSLIQIFYLLLGKPVSILADKAFAAVFAYHAARIVFGLLFLYLISRVCRRVFPSALWQMLAFCMVVTASTIPIVVPIAGSMRFGGYMSWWTVMDSLQRITFLPHLLFGQSLIIILLFDLFDSKKRFPRFWIALKFLEAMVLGLVFPPGFLFVGAVYGVLTMMEFFSNPRILFARSQKRTRWIFDDILPRIAVLSGGIPTTVYYSLMMTMYPWKRLMEFDVLHPTWFPLPEYGKALGLTLGFGIFGGIVSLLRKDKQTNVLVSWVIAWASCIFLFRYIPQQSPLRFTEMAPQVPLGILTIYLFYVIFKRAPRVIKFFSITAPLLIIVLGLGIMHSSFLWQKDFIDMKIAAGYPAIFMNNTMVYPVTGFTDALSFINAYTPKDTIILSDLTAGNYIPAYTGRRVYVGHDNTVNKEQKLTEAHMFFDGFMNSQQAALWIAQNNISYVFYGPQEKQSQKDIQALYPFLQEVYTNTDVTLYAVSSAKAK